MNANALNTNGLQAQMPLNYFVLVFILSIPLWLFGGDPLPLPINLPVSALTAFVPAIAAAILVYRQSGFAGVKELFKRAGDFKRTRNKIWYIPTLFLAPLIYLLSFIVMRVMGLPLPASINIPLLVAPIFFVMFLITGLGEELGWSGYATDPMQKRWGTIKAGLILGVVWAIWHGITFVQTHHSASWVVWQCLKTVAMRMVILWIYNNTGKSVLAATLYHTTDNVSWSLFPNYTSHYDSSVTAILTWLAAGLLIVGRGARSFPRYRQAA